VAVDGLPARFAAADDGSWSFALDWQRLMMCACLLRWRWL